MRNRASHIVIGWLDGTLTPPGDCRPAVDLYRRLAETDSNLPVKHHMVININRQMDTIHDRLIAYAAAKFARRARRRF